MDAAPAKGAGFDLFGVIKKGGRFGKVSWFGLQDLQARKLKVVLERGPLLFR
jgi:hypothetical protein